MKPERVTLKYKRVEKTQCSGVIETGMDGPSSVVEVEFNNLSFEEMIMTLHQTLTRLEAAWEVIPSIFFQRTDKNGLEPTEIVGGLQELLYENPQEAIKVLSPPPIKVVVDDRVPVGTVTAVRLEPPCICHDGSIYCSMKRGGAVECPGCGRWLATASKFAGCNNLDRMVCRNCQLDITGKAIPTKTGGWFVVDVNVLLAAAKEAGIKEFYIPRPWNKGGPWVRTERLIELNKQCKDGKKCQQDNPQGDDS